MATHRKGTDPTPAPRQRVKPPAKAAAKKATPKSRRAADDQAPPTATDAEPGAANNPSGLWRASLKALDTMRQDVSRRHTNVIETLLGIGPARVEVGATATHAFQGLEGLGLRKFEDVFDQRVAAALERLGMPTREELQALRAQLDAVLTQLQRLDAGPPPSPPTAPSKKRGPAPGGRQTR